jgi:acetyltransferase
VTTSSNVPRGPAPKSTKKPLDRTAVTIRPIGPGDAEPLERFYSTLSEESRHLRFFAVTSGLSDAQSASFCSTDHDHREGFVASIEGPDGAPQIVGHVCLEPAGALRAEVAIAVADELQGLGIGRRLMIAAFDWARWAGIETLVATMLIGNAGIHRLMASLGVPTRLERNGVDTTTVELTVPGGGALAA